MKYTKDGVVEDLQSNQIAKYVAHGWQPVQETPEEETIRPKATVKAKNTAKILDDITQQGDE
jgi:hypothetical protein